MSKKLSIRKSALKSIVAEELARHFKNLAEAPEKVVGNDVKAPKDKKPAANNVKDKQANVVQNGETTKDSKKDDQADDKLDKQVADPEDSKEQKLSDMLQGKSIESASMTEKSKLLPGATEITLNFSSNDALRILVSKSGKVSFFYNGALHNEL